MNRRELFVCEGAMMVDGLCILRCILRGIHLAPDGQTPSSP